MDNQRPWCVLAVSMRGKCEYLAGPGVVGMPENAVKPEIETARNLLLQKLCTDLAILICGTLRIWRESLPKLAVGDPERKKDQKSFSNFRSRTPK